MKFSIASWAFFLFSLIIAADAVSLPVLPRAGKGKGKGEGDHNGDGEGGGTRPTLDPANWPNTTAALVGLHKNLCEIPSIAPNELAIGDWLATYLESRFFTVEKQEVAKNRNNIFAYMGSKNRTKTLVTSHIDVVPPYINYTYHSNGTITGRGTNDAKGCVAAQIKAVEGLLAEGLIGEGDVAMLFVVAEETDGAGMIKANSLGLTWESVIFGEPTELKLSLGHKGVLRFNIEAFGKAAHSGYPQLGINANEHLIEALHILSKMKLPGSDLLGNSTLNYGVVGGGTAPNIISSYANASVAIRLAADPLSVRTLVNETIKDLSITLTWFERFYGPQYLDYDVEGFETEAQAYGTDIPNLKGSHKRYLYGPGSIFTAHSNAEFVTVTDLVKSVEGYKALIMHTLS
ncbi:Zn-dependent exopeptidase [Tuber magnatum]|uniref:Zn-dependent exopeptidase n=1 Tax=Tuber magnatum TaxID=42249 RepID=A0A317SC30_9PEZI|nr:Zn-dependent exopeptidase [Tuber magnatum]